MKNNKEDFSPVGLKEDYKFLKRETANKLEKFLNIFFPILFFGILIGLAVFIITFDIEFHQILENTGYLEPRG